MAPELMLFVDLGFGASNLWFWSFFGIRRQLEEQSCDSNGFWTDIVCGFRLWNIWNVILKLFRNPSPIEGTVLHQICQFEAGPLAQLHSYWQLMFVSGLGCWERGLVTPALDLSPWSWAFGPALFLTTNYSCFWTWMLGDGASVPASDLSPWSWAFGPASFLIRNYVCFWTWMLEDGTCQSSIGLVTLKLGLRPSAQLHS